jgi:formamidopyrimidine-DNA glycosylase
MPELPEVETTTRGLKEKIVNFNIKEVWTDLNTKDKRKIDTVANVKYFDYFKKEVVGNKILSIERRAKNILIHLTNNKTILIHLKMTGHLLFGEYLFLKKENKWKPNEKGPLEDPYNRFVHFIIVLKKQKEQKYLAFSDARKFGKITLINTEGINTSKHLRDLGPEPLDKNFNFGKFKKCLSGFSQKKIKTALMDQTIISGIGNIYSDEILWLSGIHPEKKISTLKNKEFAKIFESMKKLLKKGIYFGGDSMSDYRNIDGLPGKFQLHHNVYRLIGKKCKKLKCKGIVLRKKINGRSAHFCSLHQC